MLIKKKINNNVALAEDSSGTELIVFGKGVGFPRAHLREVGGLGGGRGGQRARRGAVRVAAKPAAVPRSPLCRARRCAALAAVPCPLRRACCGARFFSITHDRA
ncbi:MAG: CAT RNA binding domain-containing protein [Olsenella sp.]|jgi:hypothetical protein